MEDNLTILYEDNHLIVVVKPQNMPTQADSSGDRDLLTAVREYIREKYAKPGNVFVGLVHRLDRPTGGVMVFAKTSKAAARLAEQMKEGAFEKRYLAVTVGTPRDRAGRLENWLVKDAATNTVRIAPAKINADARMAVLDYKVLESIPPVCLVDVKLVTGRSHQARVQLAGLGTPIFGDVRYGGAIAKGHNLALWAYELRFKHPTTEKAMVFKVFPPTEKEPWKRFPIDKYINVSRPESRY